MKKRVFIASAILGLVASCSDETTVFSDPQDDVQIESNEQVLLNSIVYDNAGVLDIFEDDKSTTGKAGKTTDEEQAGDYPLTLVAQVDPPSYSGATNLTASHVHVDGDYAYVSYNTVEDGYAGGIDIINVSDPNNPRVTSRLHYRNADINAIKYENGYVYAVGGVDAEKSVTATSNSFVARIVASNGRLDIDAGITYGFQEGYNATDVETTSNTVVVTSGKEGYLTSYSKNNIEIQSEVPFSDLRAVAINNGTIAVLDASKGVSILNDGFQTIKEIAIDSDFGDNTKRTLAFSGDNIVVSEGSKGAGIYNVSTGSLIEYVPILINPDGVDSGDIVTNAVVTNEDVLLMANGGAGLCLSEDQGDNTDLVGIIELEGSINYVESKGDYIFAASGKSGLQIVKLNRPDESLANRCASLSIYSGSSSLKVDEGETKEYRGAKRFSKIEDDGSLLLCGSWTVSNNVEIGDNGLFEMNGTLVVGRNNKRKSIVVGKDATFRVEGNLSLYGDLTLEEGATIEFIGDASVVNIFGEVNKADGAEVSGNFVDIQNKF
ncbi:hypothetical protein [uncultured Kriegella sp.]|uniref:hypothetical protein n=1 Tax=uncultured Kriegella sp. TaxID=1798910 RepID=UPI0030DBB412|tara:strand:+ start:85846 stop:87489 length:1644 start_codon:yes stop_codon:yes gene_type:complete